MTDHLSLLRTEGFPWSWDFQCKNLDSPGQTGRVGHPIGEGAGEAAAHTCCPLPAGSPWWCRAASGPWAAPPSHLLPQCLQRLGQMCSGKKGLTSLDTHSSKICQLALVSLCSPILHLSAHPDYLVCRTQAPKSDGETIALSAPAMASIQMSAINSIYMYSIERERHTQRDRQRDRDRQTDRETDIPE